jgi:hypothetical protein
MSKPNEFKEQLKQYNAMPENDRFWLGGTYRMSIWGRKRYNKEFSSYYELMGTTGDEKLLFQMYSAEDMIIVDQEELNKYFYFDANVTEDTYR